MMGALLLCFSREFIGAAGDNGRVVAGVQAKAGVTITLL